MSTDTALSWRELNDRLRNASEKECLSMLDDEVDGPARMKWMLRIRGRYKVLREERETKELNMRWSDRHGEAKSS